MQERPNVVLINCDDLGYGDLGCYGSRVNATPAIDRIAAEGVRFTDFYMASSICSPSRAAMMTGCYPRRNGMNKVLFPGEAEGLHPDEVTVADLLRGRGYATSIIGKWHCGDQPEFLPTRHGFDSYYGLPFSNDMGIQVRAPEGERLMPPLPLVEDETVIQEQPDLAGLTERYVERAVRFLRANRDRPFFLYFAQMHVHLPHIVAPRFLRRARNGPYGAAVECIDWSVSVLMHELQRLGLDERTLVIFTSDNGSRGDHGGTNVPLRGTKATSWEGGFRVPCVARWKGVIPEGGTCTEMATAMDFFPTMAKLAGADLPADRTIDGRDILPLLRCQQGATTPHEAFFYYFIGALEAVRSGRWKLHVRRRKDEVCELYDLAADLGETRNVAAENPEVVSRMRGLADGIRAEIGDRAVGVEGSGCRPVGFVEDARPLTEYDPDCPYMWAEYDLVEAG